MFNLVKILFFSAVGIYLLNSVQTLTIAGNEEGSCNTPDSAVAGVNITWIKSVKKWFISAGSKYQLYRCAAGNSFFSRAREFEFYYGFCPSAVFDFTSSPMSLDAYSFGSYSGTYTFTTPDVGEFDLIPQDPIPGAGQHMLGVITLTDNENYFFAYKCWTQINQRGWELFTVVPEVSPKLQKKIEDHAESLGFNRTQFEFIRYDLCSDTRYQSGSYMNGNGTYLNM